MKTILIVLTVFTALGLSGCTDDEKKAPAETAMKCEAGKCGSGMTKSDAKPSVDKKGTSTMKCEAGKCGSGM